MPGCGACQHAAVAVLFSFEGVAVAFADREVLAGVDLAIPDGGCTVLVGPSGSGKTVQLGRADARGRLPKIRPGVTPAVLAAVTH